MCKALEPVNSSLVVYIHKMQIEWYNNIIIFFINCVHNITTKIYYVPFSSELLLC